MNLPLTAASQTALASAAAVPPPADSTVESLLAALRSKDARARGQAWQSAGSLGADAVRPLAALMQDPEFETARSARRALERIVADAGRPGAEAKRQAVARELIAVLESRPPTRTARDLLWLASEIAADNAVPALAGWLNHPDLREDARQVLHRLPGNAALAALQAAFAAAPEEFKPNLAYSLRTRGVPIAGYPDAKLVPTRPGAD